MESRGNWPTPAPCGDPGHYGGRLGIPALLPPGAHLLDNRRPGWRTPKGGNRRVAVLAASKFRWGASERSHQAAGGCDRRDGRVARGDLAFRILPLADDRTTASGHNPETPGSSQSRTT